MTLQKTLQCVALTATLCIAMPEVADAESVVFGYANQEFYEPWGTKRAESYDVALPLTDADLVGKTITGVRIPIAEGTGNVDFSVWITTRLKMGVNDAGEIVNNPNVCKVSVTPQGDKIEWDFEEPYVIPEGGAYVGYSFRATNSNDECMKPLMVVKEGIPGGMWIRTSNALTSWADRSEMTGVTTAMKVILEGEFPEASLEMVEMPEADDVIERVANVYATLMNRSGSAIESIDYSYEISGSSGQGHLDFSDSPLVAQWGRRYEVAFPIAELEKGAYEVDLKITKVNGVDNAAENISATTTLTIHSSMPKHNAVIEEYTGTWCGWCPRGMKGMEMLSEKYPDFIAICYHGSDPMQMRSGYPDMVGGFPGSLIDRTVSADPYTGTAGRPFGIEKDWLQRCEVFAPVMVNVKEVDWDSTNHNLLNVTTDVEWLREPSRNQPERYRLEYVLLADGLSGTSSQWAQVNYYNNTTNNDPNMAEFVNAGTSMIQGLKFNDVAVLTSGMHGVAGSITEIVPGEVTTHTYQFNVANAVNASGDRIIQNRQKLKVVVMLLEITEDKNDYGVVLNAGRCLVADYDHSGIEDVASETTKREIAITNWYDLSGRRVSNPSAGMYVKEEIYTDGGRHSEKILINR